VRAAQHGITEREHHRWAAEARIAADLIGLGGRLLVGGCRADWDTLCAETAGVVSMASVCRRSGQGAG